MPRLPSARLPLVSITIERPLRAGSRAATRQRGPAPIVIPRAPEWDADLAHVGHGALLSPCRRSQASHIGQAPTPQPGLRALPGGRGGRTSSAMAALKKDRAANTASESA